MLLVPFGNQVWVLFEEVGAMVGFSAQGGPRSFEELADLATDAIIIT